MDKPPSRRGSVDEWGHAPGAKLACDLSHRDKMAASPFAKELFKESWRVAEVRRHARARTNTSTRNECVNTSTDLRTYDPPRPARRGTKVFFNLRYYFR